MLNQQIQGGLETNPERRKTDRDFVIEALDLTFRLLQSTPYKTWENVDNHMPSHIQHSRNQIDHLRVRLIPGGRYPRRLWNLHWGFYEIGVGQYPGHSRNSKVQFFMAANQKACGGGYYNSEINRVLGQVAQRRSDCEFQPVSPRAYAWLRIYGNGIAPDPKKMAEDLVWIIHETLPLINTLKEMA